MEAILNHPMFPAAVGAVVAIIVIRFIYGILNKPKLTGAFIKVMCTDCKWNGTVGKYKSKCSQCGSENLRKVV